MIIASWNVNSVKARAAHLERWLKDVEIDVLLLQELKTEGSAFPADMLKQLGFEHQLVVGEKSYNGVAFVSKLPLKNEITALPGDQNDGRARFVGATVKGVGIYNLYAPNGNPIGTEKFDYKLSWLQRLLDFATTVYKSERPALFAGDYNIIPTEKDAKTPMAWINDALFQPEARRAFAALTNIGYTDAYRAYHPEHTDYTFWDYRTNAWLKNDGIRIDHIMLTPEATDLATKCWIDSAPRGWDSPSDHTPILVHLDI